jgi:hypothetical protein
MFNQYFDFISLSQPFYSAKKKLLHFKPNAVKSLARKHNILKYTDRTALT